jgi:hypothetical protein
MMEEQISHVFLYYVYEFLLAYYGNLIKTEMWKST